MTKKQYRCQINLNIYESQKCDRLSTQAAAGRHLRVVLPSVDRLEDLNNDRQPIEIELCEDDYPGWLALDDLASLVLLHQS